MLDSFSVAALKKRYKKLSYCRDIARRRGHFKSGDKDGGHTVQLAMVENTILDATTATRVIDDKSLI